MASMKELRECRLLTQKELAELARINYVTISRIENKQQVPSFKTRRKLAKALKVQPNEIEF